MATQDRSPSLFMGQPWSAFLDSLPTGDEKELEDSKGTVDKNDDSDSMKLRKKDKNLFGMCPSQDEFYLVVCEKCNQVIKPQALKEHMVNRHGLKDSKTLIKAALETKLPTPKSERASRDHKQTQPLKARSKEPPPSAVVNLVPRLAAMPNRSNNASSSSSGSNSSGNKNSSSSSSSTRKSHAMPVVKVERISDQLTKRTMSSNSETSAKTVLTNGTGKAGVISGAATPPTPPSTQSAHVSVVTTTTTTTTSKSSVSSSNMTLSVTTSVVTSSPVSTSVTSAATSVTSSLQQTTPAVVSPAIVTPPPSNKKSPKERKFLPCKDREFDPDKHCGCWISEIAKQCTRSLTCKTHALSLRRAVKGRSKTFDDLLKEHRAAKELLLKQKAENKAAGAATGAGAGPGGGGEAKTSVSDASAHHKDSKVPYSPSQSPTQKNKSHVKSHNSVFQKPTSSGLQLQAAHMKEEPTAVPMDMSGDRLSVDDGGGEEDQERVDNTYLPYHPQPAAMCRFGARFNGSGCYAFSRRTDYVRAAFLSALERHLHPPPHKKLCVESNLPKEPHLVTNSKDPYEFNMDDVSGGSHSVMNVVNSANKSATKPKSKSSSSSSSSSSTTPSSSLSANSSNLIQLSGNRTSKSPRDSSGSRSPGSASGSVVSSNPAKRKRSGSSQGTANSALSSSISSSNVVNTTPSMSNVIGTMAALSSTNNSITAIAIPNHGGTTLGHINATLTNKANQVPKNNINLKDFNLVFTGMDSLNGQCQYISAQLADLANPVVATDDKNVINRSRTVSGNAKTASSAKLAASNLEPLKTLPTNSVLMSQGTVIVDGIQGAVLAPVTLTSLSNSNIAVSQASPSTTLSPMFRTDTINPHGSVASPLPNGVVPSPTDKSGNSQRHLASLTKQSHNKCGNSVTMNLSPGLLQAAPGQLGTQLGSSQALSTAQLTRLQVKPIKGMQPMSVTIPIVNQALTGQQAPQHTLLVTTSSEDGTTKQELHLQQIPKSPSNVIS